MQHAALFNPQVLGLMCLLLGLCWLGLVLSDSRSWYACGHCGARSEDGHAKDCPFRSKS